MPVRTARLGSSNQIMAQLRDMSTEPDFVRYLYPKLVELADITLSGGTIQLLVDRVVSGVITNYLENLKPEDVGDTPLYDLFDHQWQAAILAALIADSLVLADALAALDVQEAEISAHCASLAEVVLAKIHLHAQFMHIVGNNPTLPEAL